MPNDPALPELTLAEEPPPRRVRNPLARHREMLVVSVLIVFLSLVLEVLPNGRVAFAGLTRYPVPQSCITQALFGLDCPGCGLTRSLIFTAHGNLKAAYRINRVGLLMAVAVLLQFPFRIYGLWRRDPFPLGRAFPSVFAYTLIAALLGNWAYNQLTGADGTDSPPKLTNSQHKKAIAKRLDSVHPFQYSGE